MAKSLTDLMTKKNAIADGSGNLTKYQQNDENLHILVTIQSVKVSYSKSLFQSFDTIEKNAVTQGDLRLMFHLPSDVVDKIEVEWEDTDIFKLLGETIGGQLETISNQAQTLTGGTTVVNPFKRVQFKGVNPRILDLSATFYPRNDKESEELMKNLISLKRNALPSTKGSSGSALPESVKTALNTLSSSDMASVATGSDPSFTKVALDAVSNSLLTSPNYFKISFNSKFLNSVIRPKIFVLKRLDISFTAAQGTSFYSDKNRTPRAIKVDLGFEEFLPIFREDV